MVIEKIREIPADMVETRIRVLRITPCNIVAICEHGPTHVQRSHGKSIERHPALKFPRKHTRSRKQLKPGDVADVQLPKWIATRLGIWARA